MATVPTRDLPPGVEITVSRNMIDIPPSGRLVIDEGWQFTDTEGHQHAGDNLRATLREVREECGCPMVDEPHDVFVEWRCQQCDHVIEPGTRMDTGTTVAGATRHTVKLTFPHMEMEYAMSPEVCELVRAATSADEARLIVEADDADTWVLRSSYRG